MTRSVSLAVLILAAFFCRSYLGGLFMHPHLASCENPKIPSDFPNDVPVYPNYHFNEARKIAGTTVLELTVKSDAQTVPTHYRQQLEAYGWQVSATTGDEETDDGDGFGISATKDARMVAVVAPPVKGGESAVRQMVRHSSMLRVLI
jgi:hypothetical protein